jgi:two-component system, NarL family, response regulator FusR
MPKRIFIVDDSKTVRKLVRTYLESRLEHIDCAEATDGLDAIHRAREVAPDLIVLDLSMPLLNGLEAGAILHDMLPKVPIILFTVHQEIISEKRAQDFGIRKVVSKMDHIDVLLDEILKYVGVAKAATA